MKSNFERIFGSLFLGGLVFLFVFWGAVLELTGSIWTFWGCFLGCGYIVSASCGNRLFFQEQKRNFQRKQKRTLNNGEEGSNLGPSFSYRRKTIRPRGKTQIISTTPRDHPLPLPSRRPPPPISPPPHCQLHCPSSQPKFYRRFWERASPSFSF